MALEIERKFLVKSELWGPTPDFTSIQQNYLSTIKDVSVRVRLRDERGSLTVKGEREGVVREEFEYEIPKGDAEALLQLCPYPPIEKRRYEIDHGGHLWEVDVFEGRHAGLILAEIELEAEDETFIRPAWLGVEVTTDARYRNSRLVEMRSVEELVAVGTASAEA
ncbi:MAG: CYTH domain-containing protein [Hyphomicrobiales bacterium]